MGIPVYSFLKNNPPFLMYFHVIGTFNEVGFFSFVKLHSPHFLHALCLLDSSRLLGTTIMHDRLKGLIFSCPKWWRSGGFRSFANAIIPLLYVFQEKLFFSGLLWYCASLAWIMYQINPIWPLALSHAEKVKEPFFGLAFVVTSLTIMHLLT